MIMKPLSLGRGSPNNLRQVVLAPVVTRNLYLGQLSPKKIRFEKPKGGGSSSKDIQGRNTSHERHSAK